MAVLSFLMPIIVLVLSFLYKLFIYRKPLLPDTVNALMELPVDIEFLTISLIIAYILSCSDNMLIGLLIFSCAIVIAILVVFLWRVAADWFTQGKYFLSIVFTIIDYIITVSSLVLIIKVIRGVIICKI